MAKNKYAKDYQIVKTEDANGKVKESYAYIGPVWQLQIDAKDVKAILIAAAAGWICYVGAMTAYSGAMHQVHVALMFVFTAIPLWLVTQTALYLRKMAGEKTSTIKRKEADMLTNRFPATAFFTFLLPAIALLGEGIALLQGKGVWPGDAIFIAGAAGLCAAGLTAFGKRNAVKVSEKASKKGSEKVQEKVSEKVPEKASE